MRWLALAIGFAVLVAIIGAQHYLGGGNDATPSPTAGPSPTPPPTTSTSVPSASTSTTRTAPSTTSVAATPLPGSADWELVGFQWSRSISVGPANVIRYRPATGELTTTAVPVLQSNGPLSFLVTSPGVIIHPWDGVSSYLVPAGGPSFGLAGLLARGGQALPGPDPGHVWVENSDDSATSFTLVDATGESTGQQISLPSTVEAYGVRPDGTGYLMVAGIGGTYLAKPDGLHLITPGSVLAAGPTRLLVYECDATYDCASQVVDRATGERSAGPGIFLNGTDGMFGMVSPNGHCAVVFGGGHAVMSPAALIDLGTGQVHGINIDLGTSGPGSSPVAFTPDGHYLLVADRSGAVIPVDTTTGKLLPPLPVPTMMIITVQPTN